MMSLESIRQLSEEAGVKAAKLNRVPLVAFEDGDIACKDVPDLGDYRPKGWTLIQSYFIDNSGFGTNNKLVLTVNQFLDKIKAGLGYAIIETGQFQLYVGEFKKDE